MAENMDIKNQAYNVGCELIQKAGLTSGMTVIVGCSTSEACGKTIGKASVLEIGQAIFDGLYLAFSKEGINIAAQCCEHLNRAVVCDVSVAKGYEQVNVIPQPKAGGSFATAAYNTIKTPVVVEEIKADAGLDIGFTLIGMHLKRVAVPLRLENNKIGEAQVIAARTRPKFIGGCRAVYNENIM